MHALPKEIQWIITCVHVHVNVQFVHSHACIPVIIVSSLFSAGTEGTNSASGPATRDASPLTHTPSSGRAVTPEDTLSVGLYVAPVFPSQLNQPAQLPSSNDSAMFTLKKCSTSLSPGVYFHVVNYTSH